MLCCYMYMGSLQHMVLRNITPLEKAASMLGQSGKTLVWDLGYLLKQGEENEVSRAFSSAFEETSHCQWQLQVGWHGTKKHVYPNLSIWWFAICWEIITMVSICLDNIMCMKTFQFHPIFCHSRRRPAGEHNLKGKGSIHPR